MEKFSTGRFSLPVLKFDHLYRLTDETGIIEHSFFAIPDKNHGYTTDDNARALQVCLRLGKRIPNREKLTDTYLKFLILAKKDNGFFNDLKPDLQWENCSNPSGEHFGRAMNALGETTAVDTNSNRRLCAASLFDQMAPFISPSVSLRTCSNLISSLHHRLVFSQKNLGLEEKIKLLGGAIIEKYLKTSNQDWYWFEEEITYDNARIPLGLFHAFEITNEKKYLKTALESLNFLLEITFDNQKDCFSFPGNKGWFTKKGEKNVFGQQPIEAGSTTECCCLAYKITGKNIYSEFAKKAFSWYLGRNILGLSLIDEKSSGIRNGLEAYGVNQNQGAESILSYLLAYHSLEKTIQK